MTNSPTFSGVYNPTHLTALQNRKHVVLMALESLERHVEQLVCISGLKLPRHDVPHQYIRMPGRQRRHERVTRQHAGQASVLGYRTIPLGSGEHERDRMLQGLASIEGSKVSHHACDGTILHGRYSQPFVKPARRSPVTTYGHARISRQGKPDR